MEYLTCPGCGVNVKSGTAIATDTRPGRGGLRRRRKCMSCNHRWTTYEVDAETFERFVASREYRERDAALMELGAYPEAAPPLQG
jgi:transcriptional regulator NrdR family protein